MEIWWSLGSMLIFRGCSLPIIHFQIPMAVSFRECTLSLPHIRWVSKGHKVPSFKVHSMEPSLRLWTQKGLKHHVETQTMHKFLGHIFQTSLRFAAVFEISEGTLVWSGSKIPFCQNKHVVSCHAKQLKHAGCSLRLEIKTYHVSPNFPLHPYTKPQNWIFIDFDLVKMDG